MSDPRRDRLEMIAVELEHQAEELRRMGMIREAGLVEHAARSTFDTVDETCAERSDA